MIVVDSSGWIDYFNGADNSHALLFSDRDFDSFVEHLGLRLA